jgi:glycine oxidase
MAKDVIVIGGGVIGCCIALRLAKGGLKVALIERDRIGCEASRAAAGMLLPQTGATARSRFFDLSITSRSMYREFAAELKNDSGIDVEYRDEGTLHVVMEGEDQVEALGWASWQEEAGLRLERLTVPEALRLEPDVTESATGAIFIPDDHQVENRLLMDSLDVAIRRAGVEVIEGFEARSILVERGSLAGVSCASRTIRAGAVVLAAGSWSSSLIEPLGLQIEIIPARGQMVAVKGAVKLNRVLHSSECYIVPRRDGRILIGATVEYTGFKKAVTVCGISQLLSSATKLLPSISDCEIIEMWSGLRPDTKDHLPVIGPCDVKNLWLAMGHFRNGILLAPVTARLIAGAIINGTESDAFEHFGSQRFPLSQDSRQGD